VLYGYEWSAVRSIPRKKDEMTSAGEKGNTYKMLVKCPKETDHQEN
jgi:hypothetical protein